MDRRRFLRSLLFAGGATALGLGSVGAWELLETNGVTGQRRRAHAHVGTTEGTTTTTEPAVTDVYARWVREENEKPGTAAWNIGDLGASNSMEGFVDRVSATIGDTVQLFVSTTAATFHVEAYRMGWYQGLGGRLVWSSPEMPGQLQAGPYVDPTTNMVEARWQQPVLVEISEAFVPGCYLFKLVASSGAGRFVPLTVRDDFSGAAYLVMNAVTTWQAYNGWGGHSLYGGVGRAVSSFANRSRIVSFDRPYEVNGAPQFLGVELPVVRLVERLGLDITYATNVDVHRHPEALLSHKALVSLGHDEYWSKAMRDGIEAARDRGVNLIFLGANAAYRQMRFEPSILGADRHEVCYKSAVEDPLNRSDSALTTVNWRDAPVTRPEATLIGEQYECNPVSADMVIVKPASWVFTGTDLTQGARLPGLVGGEYDRYAPGPRIPANVEILAHSPLTCGGRASFADMTYYSAPSGAGVFDTGTQTWVTRLDPPNQLQAVVDITTNVLTAFGRGPAGLVHPSEP